VAVKVLHERFDPASGAAVRFVDEARIAGQLQHPGIPAVHDLGMLPDGRPFLAMKLIKGRTLADLLAESDAASERGKFVAIFDQVCQAIGYAHDRKVVHRDLKPANVMVGNFGEVQVMDWGLAKVLTGMDSEDIDRDRDRTMSTEIHSLRESDGSYTQAGSVFGTPSFMPPEQAVGAVGQIDERSDVFGLGAILAVILSGQPPFIGDTSETIRVLAARGKLDDCFTRLDAADAEPELVDLCKRCLQPEPGDRPRHAGEVARAVANLRLAADARARDAELERVRAEGQRAQARAEATEQRKRRKTQMALGLTFTALLVVGGASAWWLERQAAERDNDRRRVDAERTSAQAVAAAELAARQERTAASVATALTDARTWREEGWKAVEYPARMRTTTDFAVAALRRAEGFASTGVSTADLLARLDEVRAEVADLDRHTKLLVSADDALMFLASSSATLHASTAERLRQAFEEFGWNVEAVTPGKMADQIVACRIRDKVLGFLMEWGFIERDRTRKERVKAIVRLVRLKLGDHFGRWQEALDRNDVPALVELSKTPEVLAMGPELLGALGRDLEAARQSGPRLAFLRRAVEQYPTQVWLRWDLYNVCLLANPPSLHEALENAAAAAALRPDGSRFHSKVAGVLVMLGDMRGAEAAHRRAIAAHPEYSWPYDSLARHLAKNPQRASAISALREATQTYPGKEAFHRELGRLLIADRNARGAMESYREASRLDPGNVASHYGLAIALVGNHQLREAIAECEEALRLDSKYFAAHHELARLLASGPDELRDGKRAVEHAAKACELSAWKNEGTIRTLAAAYAETGDFSRALEYQSKALALPTFPRASLPLARLQLNLYAQMKPYRNPFYIIRELAPPPREVKR